LKEVWACAAVLVALLLAAEVYGFGEGVKASATLAGKKMSFPQKGVAGGARATVALLESCHSMSEGTAADLKKAQEGDHVRLVFAMPVAVTVLGRRMAVSELVLTQPLNTGVFWLRVGNKVVRCTKYEVQKEQDFVTWRRQAR
jgi:hypothetical protein